MRILRSLSKQVAVIGALASISLVLSIPNRVIAQRFSQDSRSYFDYGEQFYERVVRSADGTTADVYLNTTNAVFSFVRSTRGKDDGDSYYAVREFTLEITEKGFTQPLLTKTVMDTIRSSRFEETTAKNLWHPKVVTLQLPKLERGRHYVLHTDVRDLSLNKVMVSPKMHDLEPAAFSPDALPMDSSAIGIGDPLFMENVSSGGGGIALARGNTYGYSRDVIGCVSIRLAKSLASAPNVELILRQTTNMVDAADTGERAHLYGSQSQITADFAMRPMGCDSVVRFKSDGFSHDSGTYLVTFKIPGAMLEQGQYKLTVNVDAGGAHNSNSATLMLIWPGMPISLEDYHDAIAPLIHILPVDSVKLIQSGSKTEIIKKLYAYWKQFDPTPATAYNERMATFYARADYAYFNFATGARLDGAMTERGRIHILFGAPTKIERTLLPGESPVEIWTYTNNVKKIFKFVDKSGHGEYKLVDVKTLS